MRTISRKIVLYSVYFYFAKYSLGLNTSFLMYPLDILKI